jgi:hypothetical protein
MLLLRLVLHLLLLAAFQSRPSGAQWGGGPSSSGGGPPPVIGGQDELVEGCFSRFDVGATFLLGRENINNLRCQRRCTEAGYALSATTGVVCLCGNDYPGERYRVETGLCNHSCSPDRAACHLFTCCGNANGTLFTVSWSGEVDPMKQLLRKLAHNYRNSTSFRRKIEGRGFCDRVSLRLARDGNQQPPLFLSVGDGCPDGWAGFADSASCFKQHWAQPATQAEAAAACMTEGGDLVTEAEQATAGGGLATYLQQQRQDGCLGQSWSSDDMDTSASDAHHHAFGPSWGHFVAATHTVPSCFICKQPRAATYPALRPHADECWFVDVANETTRGTSDPKPYPWCADCSEAYLQSDRSGQFLCADAQNWLYLSWARDPAWCLWTLLVHPDTGALVLLTRHNAALFYSAETGVLACRNLPPEVTAPPSSPDAIVEWERAIWAQGDIAWLAPSSLPHALASQHLRISIYGIRRRAPELGLRECSIAAYDTSPITPSYRCRYRPENEGGGRITDNLIRFVQTSILIYDKSHYVMAREPLPNGRLQCLNRSPTETVSCVFAYGQALLLVRRFRARFGTILLDSITWTSQITAEQGVTVRYPGLAGAAGVGVGVGGGRGGGGVVGGGGGVGGRGRSNTLQFVTREQKLVQNSLTFIFNTFVDVIRANVFIETRNWQLGVNVFPMTGLTIQFWLTTHYLRYRWRVTFEARGGVGVSLFGRQIGDGFHAVGDLVEGQDLMFHMFGSLEEPIEASVTVTDTEQGELSWWGLEVPLPSQGDEVGGQLGGRQREFLPASNPGFG